MVTHMAINPVETSPLADLSHEEMRALIDGAAWYAKYHQRIIANGADDRSAVASIRKEHFRDLYTALRKLGVHLRVPEGLDSDTST
jgi:hypothetical protein